MESGEGGGWEGKGSGVEGEREGEGRWGVAVAWFVTEGTAVGVTVGGMVW